MRKILIVSVLMILVVASAFAQLGAIRGRITDAQTGEPLPGANIFLLNTVYGAASDVQGYYLIKNVVPGSYTLVAKYVGYQEFRQSVRVTPWGYGDGKYPTCTRAYNGKPNSSDGNRN
jgi:hypothetical protein